MTVSRSDWVEANGVSTRFVMEGSGPGTLVLVHEMGGCIESWDEVVPRLEGLCVLRYDQRGFGLSEKATGFSLDTLVEDLAALLDALGLDRVSLAGAALGAAVCLAFALRHPDRVERLVVSSPATGGMSDDGRRAMQARIEQVRAHGIRAVTEAMFAVSYPPAQRRDMQRLERHRRRWLTTDPQAFIAVNQMMGAFDLLPELPKLRQPTLVIGCADDPIRPVASSAEIAKLIPLAEFTRAESGHFMPIQTPELFAAHASRFLAAQKRAPAG